MAATPGDFDEVFTSGWFNTLSQSADSTAVYTDGFFHGIFGVTEVANVMVLATGVSELLQLTTEVKGGIQLDTGAI